MSEPNYVQLMRSEEAKFLLAYHPNAFIVLSFIAIHARRVSGLPDGLIIGDALVSSESFSPGLSRQNFRTAIEKLAELKYIKIISNGKRFFEREKSTIKVTIKAYLVNLCASEVYNINGKSGNQHSNQQPTNDQPTGNHKQEGRRIDISNDISNEEDALRAGAQPAPPLRSKDLLIFNFEKWEFEGITEKDIADWKIMYPHIDLKVETLKAAQWLKNNPSKNNKKQWRKYLTGWFGRANDSIENKKAYRTASGGSSQDRRTKDINGNPVDSPHSGRF